MEPNRGDAKYPQNDQFSSGRKKSMIFQQKTPKTYIPSHIRDYHEFWSCEVFKGIFRKDAITQIGGGDSSYEMIFHQCPQKW